MNQPEVRIVVPASNEEAAISSTIREYCEHFAHSARIVVVANGCDDGTEGVVKALQARYDNLALISISAKIGKGGAVRAGFLSGGEPLVGFTDADGSTSAREFDRLVTRLREFEADGIIGSRWIRGALMQRPQPRYGASQAESSMASSVCSSVCPFATRSAVQKSSVAAQSIESSHSSRFRTSPLTSICSTGCTRPDAPSSSRPLPGPRASRPPKFGSYQPRSRCCWQSCACGFGTRSLARPVLRIPRIGSLIPVRIPPSPVLGARRQGQRQGDQYADDLAGAWQDAGHTVQWIQTSDLFWRLRIAIWYAFLGGASMTRSSKSLRASHTSSRLFR